MRRARAGAAALLALATLTLAGAAASADADEAGAARGDDFLFGISDGSPIFPYEGSATAEQLADLEHGVGAEAGRFTLRWDEIQPDAPPPVGPPHYDWTAADELVAALRKQGIAPLPMVLGSPAWARTEGCSGICPPAPEHLADFGLFVASVVARYPDAAAVEVWNEPNLIANWAGGDGPDPAAYATMFEAARRPTERIAPTTPILIGGLAFPLESSIADGSVSAADWLAGFYAAAAGGAADLSDERVALAVHPYPGLDELAGSNPQGRFAQTMASVRRAIASTDPDPARKIWVTETGVSTTAPGPDGTTTPPELQASALRFYLHQLQLAPDVAAALVYTMVDRPPQETISEEGFGLVGRGPDFTPKPAYCVLAREYASELPDRCTTG